MKIDELINEAELDQIVAQQGQQGNAAPSTLRKLGSLAAKTAAGAGNLVGATVSGAANAVGSVIGGVGDAAAAAQKGTVARTQFSSGRTGAQIKAGIKPIEPIQGNKTPPSEAEQNQATMQHLQKVAKKTNQPVTATNNTGLDTLLKNAGLLK